MEAASFPKELPDDISQPRIVVGDISQAIVQVDFIPEEVESIPFNESWTTTFFWANIG